MAISSEGNEVPSLWMYAGIEDNGAFRTNDTGAGDWCQMEIHTVDHNCDVDNANKVSIFSVIVNPYSSATYQTVYAGGNMLDGKYLWKTVNRGIDWNALTVHSVINKINQVFYHPTYLANTKNVWVVGNDGNKLFKTIDGEIIGLIF